jgi:UDP-N-acetylglucosamine diphosphorylase/glucosamine-1-phosphate N-acetyltransferase
MPKEKRLPKDICLFEDEGYKKLLPLVYFRPVYELRCGISTLREKIQRHFPKSKIALHSWGYLQDVIQDRNPGIHVNKILWHDCLFVNGRLMPNKEVVKILNSVEDDTIFLKEMTVVAAYFKDKNMEELVPKLNQTFDLSILPRARIVQLKEAKLINYPWELIQYNETELVNDFYAITKGRKSASRNFKGVHFLNPKNIFIAGKVNIYPNVILDAEKGPIYIGEKVTIYPNSYIQGPTYIGSGSVVKSGAKIYESSIGKVCKIGGEVEASIFHGYSNKQHDGFVGHSYIAEWVNLGAGTNTSDLKNNYGNVKVQTNFNSEKIDTGMMFLGLIMADHSKCGINSMFNTGSMVGFCCNVFGSDYPPKYIPSFCWGGSDVLKEYDPRKGLEVAKVVMDRRKVLITEAEEKLFMKIFELTAGERENLDLKSQKQD